MSYSNTIIALDSPDESVRMKAVLSLSKNVDMRAVSALMKVCKTDESLEVRFCAKRALSLYRDRLVKAKGRKKDSSQHRSMPQEKSSPEVAEVGCPTGQIAGGVVAAISEVKRHLTFLQSENPELQIKAIMALVQLRDSRIVLHFRKLFAKASNIKVRSALLIAFGLLQNPADLPLIVSSLSDSSFSIQSSALEAIRHSKLVDAIPHLLQSLRSESRRIRELSFNVLLSFPIEAVLSQARELMSSYEVDDRDTAVYALLRLLEPESLPLLIAALSDEAISVRLKARNALVKLAKAGFKEAEKALAAHVGEERESPDDFMTMSVIEAVPMGDLLLRSGARDRLEAIRSIVENNQVERVSSILNALVREQDPYVRSSLILALGRLKVKSAVSTLKVYLKDEDNRIRANAVEALGLIGGSEIYPLLIPCLDDKNNRVLGNAVLALGQCPYIQLDTALKKMYTSKETLMRRSLVYVLVELRNPTYFPILEKLLSDKEPLVQTMARDGLKLMASEGFSLATEIIEKSGL